MPKAPVYSATKAAVHSFTVSLRRQLAGSSVQVVEIIPPVVDTRHRVALEEPGSASTSSPALRIWIEDRSNGEGFVVETPLTWLLTLAPRRYRSIDATLIANSSARTLVPYRVPFRGHS